jgi:hypothetical protein
VWKQALQPALAEIARKPQLEIIVAELPFAGEEITRHCSEAAGARRGPQAKDKMIAFAWGDGGFQVQCGGISNLMAGGICDHHRCGCLERASRGL